LPAYITGRLDTRFPSPYHKPVEKWIELERKLDPNWTEEKSKALYQCKEAWLKESTERLNEARANLHAAEDVDILSLLQTGEGNTSRAASGSAQDDE
jgi:hypothetical protein